MSGGHGPPGGSVNMASDYALQSSREVEEECYRASAPRSPGDSPAKQRDQLIFVDAPTTLDSSRTRYGCLYRNTRDCWPGSDCQRGTVVARKCEKFVFIDYPQRISRSHQALARLQETSAWRMQHRPLCPAQRCSPWRGHLHRPPAAPEWSGAAGAGHDRLGPR